jgi:beta-carotene hydroxylase
MQQQENLDQAAVVAAKAYMGEFARPTVIYATTVIGAYAATLVLAATNILPLPAAFLLVGVLTYLAYTILHESAHGTISGSDQSRRWINEWLGYAAAWVLMIPLTAHRHEHLAHHRNTNDPDEDPDFLVSGMTRSPRNLLRLAPRLMWKQYQYYFTHRWGRGPRSQDLILCAEVAAITLPRVAFFAAGFWAEGLVLLIGAWLLGVSLTLFLFAYLVHTPHQAVGRYVDTSTILVDGLLGRVVTGLWVYQNYHSIHHLFPRVPFYRYPALFADIEPIMVARGAPVYRLGFRGMQPVTPATS